MSKINIKAKLSSKDDIHIFEGKGIKNKNEIIYKDKDVSTKIILDEIISIERKADYFLKLNLKKGIKLEGEYITKYGNMKVETTLQDIKQEENKIELIYKLEINDEYVDTFEYNFEYSIDS